MRSYFRVTMVCIATASALMLAGCGKKAADDTTNIVEMNPSDGTMNDMTVVESATLDQAGGDQADGNQAANGADAANGSNAM